MRTWATIGGRLARAGVGSALVGVLHACASTGPGPAPPLGDVIAGDRLCMGTDSRLRGERDPACAPDATHEAVELVNHLAGCRAGLRGPAEFRLGEQLLATLRPGERKSFSLPRGDVELTIVEGGVPEVRALSLAGSGPLLVEIGCDPKAFVGGLQPLVLQGARTACGGGESPGPIKVRAGGLDLAIGPDEVQTLLIPQGSHLVRVAGVERTVEIAEGGALVLLAPCASAEPERNK